MPVILEEINRWMTEDAIQAIGEQIDANELKTRRGVAAALPLLLGGLARNANRSATDARALESALKKDHDGSVLEDLTTYLKGTNRNGHSVLNRSLNGDAILDHILTGKREAVETGISRASGLDVQQVSRLLTLLAPIVMSALGRIKRERGLNHDAVATLLNKERAEIERSLPDIQRGALLDYLEVGSDNQISDEVAALGARFADKDLRPAVSGP